MIDLEKVGAGGDTGPHYRLGGWGPIGGGFRPMVDVQRVEALASYVPFVQLRPVRTRGLSLTLFFSVSGCSWLTGPGPCAASSTYEGSYLRRAQFGTFVEVQGASLIYVPMCRETYMLGASPKSVLRELQVLTNTNERRFAIVGRFDGKLVWSDVSQQPVLQIDTITDSKKLTADKADLLHDAMASGPHRLANPHDEVVLY